MKSFYLILSVLFASLASSGQVCTGDFTFHDQAEVDQFLVDNPTCTTIEGNVSIDFAQGADPVLNVLGLQNIITINGDLSLSGGDVDMGASLLGLANLQSTQALTIYGSPGLSHLEGLENLTNVTNVELWISALSSLTPLDGITSASSIRINFYSYSEWDSPASFYDVFPNLLTIPGNIWLDSGNSANFSGFNGLTHIGGSLIIGTWSELAIENFDGFHNLETIAGGFQMEMGYLGDFLGFENLVSMASMFVEVDAWGEFTDFESLTSIDNITITGGIPSTPEFNSLQEVGGDVAILGYFGEVSFNALEAVGGVFSIQGNYLGVETILETINVPFLQSVAGDFYLQGTLIYDLDPFNSLQTIGGLVAIQDNANLSECAIDVLCDKLESNPEMVTIENNATGCANLEEAGNGCQLNFVSGTVFADVDCDGIFNNDDVVIQNPIMLDDTQNPVGSSDGSGLYYIALPNNATVDFSTTLPAGFLPVSGQSVTTDGVNQGYTGYDFAICPDPVFHDLQITATSWPPRPGFDPHYRLYVKNNGGHLEQAIVTFDFTNMPGASFVSSSPGSTVTATIVTFDLNLTYLETVHLDIILHVDASVPLGTQYYPAAFVEMQNNTDSNPLNDSYIWTQTVLGSFDPNDKTVNIPAVDIETLSSEDVVTLDYTIRFQNTGTAEAIFVRVEDVIEEDLDLTTFQMLDASHDFQLSFLEDRKVEWLFENILLPDSATDEAGSHGYIHFRIKTKDNLQLTDTISNNCAIYFDYNEPVITNTATTEFYICDNDPLFDEAYNFCEGDLISISVSGDWENPMWLLADVVVDNDQLLEVEGADPGTYNYLLSLSEGYCHYMGEFEVNVYPTPPTPVIMQDGNTLNVSGEGIFTWFVDGDIIIGTGNNIEISESGIYSVQVEDDYCASVSAGSYYEYTGIEEDRMDFYLQPNPASGHTVLVSNLSADEDLVITDALGKKVYTTKITSGKTTIDLGQLAAGIYYVMFGGSVQKLIVR